MNRLALTAALAVSLTGGLALAQAPAPAQQPDGGSAPYGMHGHHHHPTNPQQEAEHLGKRLGLSADQTAKLEPIFAEQQQKMFALHQSGQNLSREERFQQMRAIQQSTHEQLSTVLTPEQMQQLHSMHHRGWGHRGGEAPNGGQPGA